MVRKKNTSPDLNKFQSNKIWVMKIEQLNLSGENWAAKFECWKTALKIELKILQIGF